jgi:lipocalin
VHPGLQPPDLVAALRSRASGDACAPSCPALRTLQTVHLEGVPVAAPYWVVDVGPVNADGQYDYAVVSDPLELSLFVLARNYTRFMATYDSTVRAWLGTHGFNGPLNSPLPTTQLGCSYW